MNQILSLVQPCMRTVSISVKAGRSNVNTVRLADARLLGRAAYVPRGERQQYNAALFSLDKKVNNGKMYLLGKS